MQLGFLGGIGREFQFNQAKFWLLPLFHLAPDYRTFVLGSQSNQYAGYTRIYADEGNRNADYPSLKKSFNMVDPVNGASYQVTDREVFDLARSDNQFKTTKTGKNMQFAGNFDLFKNHLVILG